MESRRKSHVVIVGGGFAGIQVAKELREAPVEVTLLDRSNHHLFQPLLYQVATSGLSPADISAPLRAIFKNQQNVRILWRNVLSVDTQKKAVITDRGEVPYDQLVLATGSEYDYFGHDEWREFAPNLKTLQDAIQIRKNILKAFEVAEECADEESRKKWMTFVLVGAGPTGVELAGAIAELSRQSLLNEYRNINPSDAQILLLEAGPEILSAFSPKLSAVARQDLLNLGVDVCLNTKVLSIEKGKVITSNREIYSENILWTAGVRATKVAEWLNLERGPGGRVKVDPYLAVPETKDIYVIGDAAFFPEASGRGLPAIAPVAIQQGKYLGKRLAAAALERGLSKRPFMYSNKGMLATIGRARAIAELPGLALHGFAAWLVWTFVHIAYLIGFENRALVLTHWAWYYFTFKRGARLITEARESPLMSWKN